jgi:hypothetical protein
MAEWKNKTYKFILQNVIWFTSTVNTKAISDMQNFHHNPNLSYLSDTQYGYLANHCQQKCDAPYILYIYVLQVPIVHQYYTTKYTFRYEKF